MRDKFELLIRSWDAIVQTSLIDFFLCPQVSVNWTTRYRATKNFNPICSWKLIGALPIFRPFYIVLYDLFPGEDTRISRDRFIFFLLHPPGGRQLNQLKRIKRDSVANPRIKVHECASKVSSSLSRLETSSIFTAGIFDYHPPRRAILWLRRYCCCAFSRG